jgi:hypothetical protein
MTPRLLHALSENSIALQAAFNQATIIACHEAWRRARPKPPQEPDLVAMLVLEGTRWIANAMRSVFRQRGVQSTVSSVYCHQRPMVQFDRSQKKCELGDVLFVHRHHSKANHKTFGNALLLQAKSTDAVVLKVQAFNERVQLRLYERWPRFEYVLSGQRLNGQQRDVRPKARHAGAQYLLIDSSGPSTVEGGLLGVPGAYPMAIWPAADTLSARDPFADHFLRFLMGASGRPFLEYGEYDKSGWSQVVWDLLTYGIQSTFNRRRAGLRDTDRHAGDALSSALDGMCFCTEAAGETELTHADALRERARRLTWRHNEPPTDEVARHLIDPGDFGGISVVLIETAEE